MSESNNPFSLYFGKQPLQYIDRMSQTEMVTDVFNADIPSTQVYMITGVRGSGKTVMMTAIANKLGENSKWIVVNLNPSRDMLHAMASKMYKEPVFKPLLAELKVDFSLLGIGVSISKSDNSEKITEFVRMKMQDGRFVNVVDSVIVTIVWNAKEDTNGFDKYKR